MKRRNSLKLISALPLVAAFPSLATAKGSAPAKAKKSNLIDEKDTLASAMQYKHDASKAPAMRTNKKAFCHNCAKYNKCMEGDKECKPLSEKELKTATEAPCQIFTGKNVAKEGWCLSWQPKA